MKSFRQDPERFEPEPTRRDRWPGPLPIKQMAASCNLDGLPTLSRQKRRTLVDFCFLGWPTMYAMPGYNSPTYQKAHDVTSPTPFSTESPSDLGTKTTKMRPPTFPSH